MRTYRVYWRSIAITTFLFIKYDGMRGGKMKDEGIRFYFYCRGSLPASQKPIIVVPEHVQYVYNNPLGLDPYYCGHSVVFTLVKFWLFQPFMQLYNVEAILIKLQYKSFKFIFFAEEKNHRNFQFFYNQK